ncbi:MAG: DNA mismatch repair protein MutS [Oscillospiraceae bacterium]
MKGLTPMMQQYFAIKESHKDHIVFYRLGDFYEMFFDDALLASKELELTLTGRDCGLAERAPMCGVPHHSAENYIARLIRKGYKVAICEQMEDPAVAKGLVSREVIRVITPGTLMETNMLEEDVNNFLCCINLREGGFGLAFADISTGEVNLIELDSDADSAVINELARYTPREVVFSPAFVDRTGIAKYMKEKLFCTADLLEDEYFQPEYAADRILTHFQKDALEDLGIRNSPRCVGALGALLHYLEETQKTGIERLVVVRVLEESRFMNLDLSARGNLELLQTLRTKEKRGSLLWVLDRTKTPMGKRLIRSYISQPLVNPADIDKRLNAVEELCRQEMLCGELQDSLSGIFDVERLITRVVYGSAGPREYKSLHQAMNFFPQVKNLLSDTKSGQLHGIWQDIDGMDDLRRLLEEAIVEEPPVKLADGGVIQNGYSVELDELRDLIGNARQYLSKMETGERERTGIKNLKVGYNKVFGYYLEVTKSYQHLVPPEYIRKQTLANCERYITRELKELEDKIFSANEKALVIEAALFEEVRKGTVNALHRIQRSASAIARLDVLCSFAVVSLAGQYVRPVVNLDNSLNIKDGRHPVVERMLEGAPFVPNDTLLDVGDNQIAVITGPNMAGKSTYMRQTALIVLMAQIGCFVPAASATIGVVDGIYTRIGASDDLTSGQSTFMVEMVEVAEILKSATAKSLLILDEIGRGTSTYDGMSIARAVIEFVADPKKLGAKTLFATHYHELTEMEDTIPGVKNYNIAAKKRGDEIIFLRRIVRGGADDTYGIEVSKLAGVPTWVINRAHEVLQDLENAQPVRERKRAVKQQDQFQISFEHQSSAVEEMLEKLDVNTLTPIEALTTLYTLKEELKQR